MTFFGKYRGKVVSNLDPLQLGRLQVSCPAVLGDGTTSWAMPSVPYAGRRVGWFMLPGRDTNVWVEFEGGDPDYPIWSGCFWGTGELPVTPATPDMKVIRTEGLTVTMRTLAGVGAFIVDIGPPLVPHPLTLTMDAKGITLTAEPARLTLAPTGLECQVPPSTITIGANGVELGAAAASAKVAPAGLELSFGASSVKLSGASVSLNNGALEVI